MNVKIERGSDFVVDNRHTFTLRRRWQQLASIERFFDINNNYYDKNWTLVFLTGDIKNTHCAICVFDKYAGFSQL